MPAAIPIAGAVAGSVVSGAMNKGGKGQQQTASKEPWGPAAPILEQALQDGKDLNAYYQRNPFNAVQRAGYENLLGDFDAFRHGAAPGLMNFANGLMGANYRRAPAGTEMGGANPYAPGAQNNFNSPNVGLLSQGGPNAMPNALQQAGANMRLDPSRSVGDSFAQMGGGQQGTAPAGALQAAMGQTQGMPNLAQMQGMGWSDTLATPMPKPAMDGGIGQGMQQAQGVFQSPAGVGYSGLLDWQALNPWTSILDQRAKDADKTKKPDLTNDEIIEDYLRRRDPSAYQEWHQSRYLGQGGA